LIYINDLPKQFQGMDFVLYADDTSILIVDKDEITIQQKLTLLMTQLEIWLSSNDLVVNTEKTVLYHSILIKSPPLQNHVFKSKII